MKRTRRLVAGLSMLTFVTACSGSRPALDPDSSTTTRPATSTSVTYSDVEPSTTISSAPPTSTSDPDSTDPTSTSTPVTTEPAGTTTSNAAPTTTAYPNVAPLPTVPVEEYPTVG